MSRPGIGPGPPQCRNEHSCKELFEQLIKSLSTCACKRIKFFAGKQMPKVERWKHHLLMKSSPKEVCQKCLKSQRSTEAQGVKRQVVFAYHLLKVASLRGLTFECTLQSNTYTLKLPSHTSPCSDTATKRSIHKT